MVGQDGLWWLMVAHCNGMSLPGPTIEQDKEMLDELVKKVNEVK